LSWQWGCDSTEGFSELGGEGGERRRRREGHEHEPPKEGEARREKTLDEMWAELAERVKRREEVEARLKKVEENFRRHEAERARAEEEKRWAEFVESVKKGEPLEDEMRRWGEELARKEQTPARGPEGSAAEVGRPAATRSNTTEVGGRESAPVKEDEARLHGGAERSLGIEQRTPPESLPKERVFPERPTVEELDRAIRQHPHLEKSVSDVRYGEAVEYCHGTYHRSREMGAYQKKPILIDHLERQEEARLVHELHVPAEAQIHRVSPEVVKKVIGEAERPERLGIDELNRMTHELYKANPDPEKNRVHYAELYQVGVPLIEDRFRDVAQSIRENRAEMERTLNQRLGLVGTEKEVRVAVCDDRLYYWTIDLSRERWENVLYNERLYLRTKEDKTGLIDDMRKHLHVRGGPDVSERYLNDIIGQMSRIEGAAADRTKRYDDRHYFDGEVLHLVLDLKGMRLEDIKDRISHLGTSERGRISDPQFPEPRSWRMRTVAIIESDGHLTPVRQLRYFEDNDARRMTIYEEFGEFGEFRLKERIKRTPHGSVVEVSLPMSFGRMMKYWGVTEGDKAIRNRGLDERLTQETPEIKVDYAREMVPQDGCFSRDHFSIVRDNALHMGVKEVPYAKYGIQSVVSAAEVEFVRERGRPLPAGLGYEYAARKMLYVTEIRQIAESNANPYAEAARKLYASIFQNPNRLLKDEVEQMMKPLGISMAVRARNVIYYRDSQRLSVSWEARTSSIADAIKWALIAPPNHPKKMSAVVKFVTENKDSIEKAKEEIQRMGLGVHPTWEGIL